MKKQIFLDIICCLFIVLFIYAAASKFLDFEKFRIQLGKSPLLTAYAGWVAWTIPYIEIGIAILLSIPRWRLAGLYAAFALMVMFSAYIVAITRFSDYVPCSCGGVLQNMTWNQHLVFNLLFVGLGATGVLIEGQAVPKTRIAIQI
jgi:hypothetical protein